MFRRRLFALIAAFAVAFAALWPLVSAARPRSPDIPAFICTQSGGAQHPGAPADAGDDFHCALCIASAEAIIPVVAMVHAAPPMHAAVDALPERSTSHRVFLAQPPPGRGPPHLS